jgi:hypothetical protein
VEAQVTELQRSRRADEAYERLPQHRKARSPNFEGSDWRSFVHSGQLLLDSHRKCAFRVSIPNRERALAMANTFFVEAEARGYSISFSANDGRYNIDGHGGSIDFRISEKLVTKTRKIRRYDGKLEDEKYREPSGCISMYLEIGYFSGAQFSDAPNAALELQLNRAFIALSKLVVRCRVRARQEELDRLERQRTEEEAAARRRREEEERRRLAHERARRQELYRETARWSKSLEIRRYLEHVSGLVSNVPGSAFEEWRSWAAATAERLDPSAKRVNSFQQSEHGRPMSEM